MKHSFAFIKSSVLALVCLCAQLSAQDSLVKRSRVYLGLSFSSYYLKDVLQGSSPYYYYVRPEIKTRMPLRFGLDVKIRVTNRFGISTGLLADISRRQVSQTVKGTLQPNDVAHMRVDYSELIIALPVRADFRLMDGMVAPFLTGGWLTGMWVQENIASDITYGDGHQKHETGKFYRSKGDNQLLLLLQFGAGLDVNYRRFKLQIFPLYEIGTDWIYLQVMQKYVQQHRFGGMLSVSYNL